MEQKFDLKDLTKEEQNEFLKDFQEFLVKKELYFEPAPVYKKAIIEGKNEKGEVVKEETWTTKIEVILKKKVKIVDAEVIPSPFIENENNPAS